MKAIIGAIAAYLRDWKNLLVHAVIGIGILVFALVLPVSVPVRIAILAAVVLLNVIRMRLDKKRRTEEPKVEENEV